MVVPLECLAGWGLGGVGISDPQCHGLQQRLCFELAILTCPLIFLSSYIG